MGAYGKTILNDGGDIVNETIKEDFVASNVVEEQVAKFDNSYGAQEKLQELYNEFDKITLDQEKIEALTQVKVNAVANKVPFRVVTAMTTICVATILLLFLCIYNIFVINGMSTDISYLQEEVAACEYDLVQAEGIYDGLTNTQNIQSELTEMGYESVPSSNIVAVSIPSSVENANNLQGETNWFDSVCNFISRIFG